MLGRHWQVHSFSHTILSLIYFITTTLWLAHGADVLFLTSPSLPSLPLLDVETSLGKRTAQLDLGKESDTNKLRELVNNVDVFLQAYRPGGLEKKGFGVQDVVDLRQGIVYAGLRAWGWEGPWAMRKGVSMSRVI